MNYEEELEMEKWEKEVSLRDLIKKTKEFKEMFPELSSDDLLYSEEEALAVNEFYQTKEQLYNQIKEEVEVDYALATLKRRGEFEMYKRLNLPCVKNYWDNDDVISIISDEDLMTLLMLIKKIDLKDMKK